MMAMKHLVICADGTWNSPQQPIPTNVLRISRAVAASNQDGHEQVVFYDWGIGSYYNKVGGGLSGSGLEKNICDCYRFIVHNYQPGDKLYFFGFSRGAFTVRSLAGFIRNCGIIRPESSDQIDYAFNEIYKKRHKKSHPRSKLAVAFRHQHAVADRSEIAFLGAFGFVGLLGCRLLSFSIMTNTCFMIWN